jgi:hypothetical protein
MSMRPATRRRLCRALVVGLGLTALTIGILTFVDATALDAKRCAPSIWQSQWPKYIGCAAAAHEGLAGGLVGVAGALFAAWLAFDVIQQQLAEERDRFRDERQRQDQMRAEEREQHARIQAEAKAAAVVCIAPTIHAAPGALLSVEAARKVTVEKAAGPTDKMVALGATHVGTELSSFAARESLRDLALDDRLLYLSIIGTLNVFVNISTNPSPALSRTQRLEGQRHALMNLHTYLQAFDAELSRVYARDSGTQP